MPDNKELSPSEIREIEEEAKNEEYKDLNMGFPGSEKTDIIRVTKKGLIFFHGNKKTGVEHFEAGHRYFSFPKKWGVKNSEGWLVPKYKSWFSLRTTPIYDYWKIAEGVYAPENKNEAINRDPDKYEIYDGEVELKHIGKSKYRLILYKGTKIIHNLFPLGDVFNPKPLVNYHKVPRPESVHYLTSGLMVVKIPYVDQKRICRYKAIFRHDNINGIKSLYVQINSERGKPIVSFYIGDSPTEKVSGISDLDMRYAYTNLPFVDKMISCIDRNVEYRNHRFFIKKRG